MSDTTFNKETVEEIPFGGMTISLTNCVSPQWREQQVLDKLSGVIQQIKADINDKAPFCELTRLIIITADFGEEVTKWQHLLNLPVLTSTDSNAEAVAKTLVWGDGLPKTTYPIIIISEAIAIGLMDDNNSSLQLLSKGILAHEFGHTHDNFLRLNVSGDQSNPLNTWRGIKQEIAENLWSEFFAESVAKIYKQDANTDTNIALAITLAKSGHEAIIARTEHCRTRKDAKELFRVASSELSKTCNQFGRVAGLISGHADNSKVDKIKDELASISEGWKTIFHNIYVEVQNINSVDKLSEASFTNLQMVIETLFNLNGIYPEETEQGFTISIR